MEKKRQAQIATQHKKASTTIKIAAHLGVPGMKEFEEGIDSSRTRQDSSRIVGEKTVGDFDVGVKVAGLGPEVGDPDTEGGRQAASGSDARGKTNWVQSAHEPRIIILAVADQKRVALCSSAHAELS